MCTGVCIRSSPLSLPCALLPLWCLLVCHLLVSPSACIVSRSSWIWSPFSASRLCRRPPPAVAPYGVPYQVPACPSQRLYDFLSRFSSSAFATAFVVHSYLPPVFFPLSMHLPLSAVRDCLFQVCRSPARGHGSCASSSLAPSVSRRSFRPPSLYICEDDRRLLFQAAVCAAVYPPLLPGGLPRQDLDHFLQFP